MAVFNFARAVLPEGTTFIFDLWVCVANGAGGFSRHLVDNKPEAATSSMDEFVDNLDEILLPGLLTEIKEQFDFNATPTRASQGFSELDSTQPGEFHNRFSFGLRNAASAYQEAAISKTQSALEKDLDELLSLGDGEATACRGVWQNHLN